MKFRSRVFSLDAAPCFLVEYEITCSSEVTLPSCPRALLTTSTPPLPARDTACTVGIRRGPPLLINLV